MCGGWRWLVVAVEIVGGVLGSWVVGCGFVGCGLLRSVSFVGWVVAEVQAPRWLWWN